MANQARLCDMAIQLSPTEQGNLTDQKSERKVQQITVMSDGDESSGCSSVRTASACRQCTQLTLMA